MRKSLLQPPKNYDIEVKQRVKMYRIILYSQIISTVLVAVGFIVFLLIIGGVIHF